MLRVGIFFGGMSREREVSFAGGRTVYDNLDKTLFVPVPIFVDSQGQFVLLKWQYMYKGAIRDFYIDPEERNSCALSIGQKIVGEDLPKHIDIAFSVLHGIGGEDGSLQGLLSWLNIPYVGSGIFASALGMDKTLQKRIMRAEGFLLPDAYMITRKMLEVPALLESRLTQLMTRFKDKSCVVKPANEGSSIGVQVLRKTEEDVLRQAIYRAFFVEELCAEQWQKYTSSQKDEHLLRSCDLRKGVGLPLTFQKQRFFDVAALRQVLDQAALDQPTAVWQLTALYSEHEVWVEEYVEGREFSCIVLEDEQGEPLPLVPTEIYKQEHFYSYTQKYLPGASHKATPMQLTAQQLSLIRSTCAKLYKCLHAEGYARLDGFLTENHQVYLNDPNTSSGMLPSSLLFHQAAAVGLSPTALLTYLMHSSVKHRLRVSKRPNSYADLLSYLENRLDQVRRSHRKQKVAILTGGASAERHIAVETARNMYEKLSSSSTYTPILLFLKGAHADAPMYRLPIALLLKDNADDIAEQLTSEVTSLQIDAQLWSETHALRERYGLLETWARDPITYRELAQEVSVVFLALHGRPGEDGSIQQALEEVGLPYNGSGVESSRRTIDKYATAQYLAKKGFQVPKQRLVYKREAKDKHYWQVVEKDFCYPMIAKPVDEGCSSAVKKIHNREELISYASAIFRSPEADRLAETEEFPKKDYFLLEEYIGLAQADALFEVSVGFVTHMRDKDLRYEVFSPSETLARGEILSLEEKFLAGEGQNITPARLSTEDALQRHYTQIIQQIIEQAARTLSVEGYGRMDAFVRICNQKIEVIILEVNSLPGMTPATCIFHQAALKGYTPYDLIAHILQFAQQKHKSSPSIS